KRVLFPLIFFFFKNFGNSSLNELVLDPTKQKKKKKKMKEAGTKKNKRRQSQKDRKGLLSRQGKEEAGQELAYKIHSGPSHDLGVITKMFGNGFEMPPYLKNTLGSIEPTEAEDILHDLVERRNETAKDLSRKVGSNYVQFIDMSRNVMNIENQMEEVSTMLKNFGAFVKKLNETNMRQTKKKEKEKEKEMQYLVAPKPNEFKKDIFIIILIILISINEELYLYNEDMIQSFHEQKERLENDWQAICSWHEQLSQYVCNRQFTEAVDLIINAPVIHHGNSANAGVHPHQQQHQDDWLSQQEIYTSLFAFHRNTLRALVEQQLHAFTKMSAHLNLALNVNTIGSSSGSSSSNNNNNGGGVDDGHNSSMDLHVHSNSNSNTNTNSSSEIRRKEMTLHLMRLGYVDEAMKLLLLYKSKQLKSLVRQIIMSGDIKKYIRDLCDIFFMHIVRTADDTMDRFSQRTGGHHHHQQQQQQHLHLHSNVNANDANTRTVDLKHANFRLSTDAAATAAVAAVAAADDERKTETQQSTTSLKINKTKEEETAMDKWSRLDWQQCVDEENQSLTAIEKNREEDHKDNRGGGDGEDGGDDDDDDDDNCRNSHMSGLVVWICQELNQFIELFEQQVFVFLELKYRAIGDCLRV
ncbi:hypothetical protein RFI_03725, partial [Reticulomyxa filosa]